MGMDEKLKSRTAYKTKMLIAKFFENQEIFITGGSGFIGKALIEKLLRSCPGLSKIYVLLRGKKNRNAEERLKDILKTALFDRVREERPEVLHKLQAVEGDCGQLGLGIKVEDLEKIKNVSIVYHSAASVRFDDHLRDAILLNTRGTYEMLKLAEKLKNLKVFLHVSTTYCNPDKRVVEEKVYPPYADWRTTIKLAETYDTQILNIFDKKYSNNQPNTYTFTKSLAEQIAQEYMDKIPIVIYRPSIVISSLIEPVPGWMDNFNGPNGLLVACGIGILRTNHGDPDVFTDFVPVDIVVRGMIVSSYHRGTETQLKKKFETDSLRVINCATGEICPITMGTVIDMGKRLIKENPFEKTLWVPGGSITKCYVWNLIRFIFLHIFAALFVDSILRLSNNKPFLLRLQRRIFAANMALHYFTTISWKFENANFYRLHDIVPPKEMDIFGFIQYSEMDYDKFYRHAIRGARLFLLNEPAECSKSARTRMKIFEALDFVGQFIICVLIARFVLRFIYFKYLLH